MQAPEQGQRRRQDGQRFAVTRCAPDDARPAFGQALGRVKKVGQQSMSTTGDGHCGDQCRRRHSSQNERFEACPLLPPVLFATAPDEELGEHPTAIEFRFANHALAGQHAQQTTHAELTPIGKRRRKGNSGLRPAACRELATVRGFSVISLDQQHGWQSRQADAAYSRPAKKRTIVGDQLAFERKNAIDIAEQRCRYAAGVCGIQAPVDQVISPAADLRAKRICRRRPWLAR